MLDPDTIRSAAERNVQLLTLRPARGFLTGNTKARVVDGLRCEIEDGAWRLAADMPAKAGGDETAPTPGVLGRGALASCLAIGVATWGARLGIADRRGRGRGPGRLRRPWRAGHGDGIAPGYTEVRYLVSIDSPASAAEIDRAARPGRAPQPLSRRVRPRDAASPRRSPQRPGGLTAMDPRLQRRVQRYGWDRAAAVYEHGWQAQLAPAHELMLEHGRRCGRASACSTSPAAPGWSPSAWPRTVGTAGAVVGTDISGEMVEAAARRGRCAQARATCGSSAPMPRSCHSATALRRRPVRSRADVRARPGPRRSARCAGCSGPAAGRPWRSGARGGPAAGPRSSRSPMPASRRTSARCSSISARRTCSRAPSRRQASPTSRSSASTRSSTTPRPRTRWRQCSAAARWRWPTAASTTPTRRAAHAEYLNSIAAYATGDGYRIPGEFVVAAARSSVPQTRRDRELEHARI